MSRNKPRENTGHHEKTRAKSRGESGVEKWREKERRQRKMEIKTHKKLTKLQQRAHLPGKPVAGKTIEKAQTGTKTQKELAALRQNVDLYTDVVYPKSFPDGRPPFENQPSKEWDNIPDFFVFHENGENPDQFFEEDEVIVKGKPKKVFLKRDGEVTFYRVEDKDTISDIRDKLVRIPGFGYLKDKEYLGKMAFNIPPGKVPINTFIPIPLEAKDRILSDRQFVNYCHTAIWEMKGEKHPYSADINRMLQTVREEDLLIAMLTIAKQESGGKPLGQFQFHRWEPGPKVFSYSIFHVLMDDLGERTRKNLGMTEGQLYHPKNAAKLFLAFLIEKAKETPRQPGQPRPKPEDFLPIHEHIKEFAAFYNGTEWKRINPDYDLHLAIYCQEARELMTLPSDENLTAAYGLNSPEPFLLDKGTRGIEKTLTYSNDLNTKKRRKLKLPQHPLNNIIVRDSSIQGFAKRIQDFLSKGKSEYQTGDRIGVWKKDDGRVYVRFQRGGETPVDVDLYLNPTREELRGERLVFFKPVFKTVGRKGSLSKTIEVADKENAKQIGEETFLGEKGITSGAVAKKIQGHLVTTEKKNTVYPEDSVAVGEDETSVYVRFARKGKEPAEFRNFA